MSAVEKRSRFAEASREDVLTKFLTTGNAKSTQADRLNGVVKMALLASSKNSKAELIRILEKSKRSAKLPAPDELIQECVKHGLHLGIDNFYGIHDRSVLLCILLIDLLGLRPRSLVKSDKHDHAILVNQVAVTFTDRDGEERVVRGGSEDVGSIPEGSKVSAAAFTYLSNKHGSFEPVTHTFERTDPRAELLITLTADYMKHAGIGPEEVFASYVRKFERKKGKKA